MWKAMMPLSSAGTKPKFVNFSSSGCSLSIRPSLFCSPISCYLLPISVIPLNMKSYLAREIRDKICDVNK